jgi:hypothetical protein
MRYALILGVLIAATTAQAQWEIQTAPTTADLRGIDNVGKGIAWASGSDGAVLRTTDDGAHWQLCPTPPDAEQLDFRGIQAFDEKTAIVMSTGKGALSRLYKTTDGCKSWTLLLTNPYPEGSWAGIVADNLGGGAIVIGDQVGDRFSIYASRNSGLKNWFLFEHPESAPTVKIPQPHSKDEVPFAASNSIIYGDAWNGLDFVTGGRDGSYLYATKGHSWPLDYNFTTFVVVPIPLAKGPAAGAFSITTSTGCNPNKAGECAYVIVGGDYMKPDESKGTAAYAITWGPPNRFKSSITPPHGFRSAVAYDAASKTWITVGPNGTDISTDDGRNWRALHPNPALHEPTDADRDWNALSLPYVVGPHGRIGKLRPTAMK